MRPLDVRQFAARARALRARCLREHGASALELAIIAAVLVVAVSIVGGAIYSVVQSRANDIATCGSAAPGQACGSGAQP